MWGAFVLCLLFAATTEICAVSFPIVNFTLSLENQVLSCDATEERKYRVTAVEGQPLEIIINYKKLLNEVRCTYKNNVLGNTTILPPPAHFMTVPVAANMSGVWKCTIYTHRGTTGLQPIIQDGDATYVMANCYLQLDVRIKEPPLFVLVNNLILRPTASSYNIIEYDYSVEYRYMNNDEVDIYCFQNTNTDECTLELEYDHVKDVYKVADAPTTNFTSSIGINIYMVLRAIHNMSYMNCIRKCKNETRILKIIFISTSNFYNDINLLVNGRRARITTDLGTDEVRLTYRFFKNEPINVICDSNITCSNICGAKGNCNFTLPDIKGECTINCKNKTILIVKVTINNNIKVKPLLSLAYSKDNTAMDIYAPGGTQQSKRLIFYEFDKNQNDLIVNCSAAVNSGAILNISTSNAEITEFNTNKEISASLKLPRTEIFKIYLKKKLRNYNQTKEIVTLVFIPKIIEIIEKPNDSNEDEGAPTENSLTLYNEDAVTDTTSEYTKIYIGVGVIMVIVLLCLVFVFYKLTKRNQAFQTQSMVAINDEIYSETQIPAHPPQWTEDVYERSEYTVPFGQPDTYATPIPKHLRHLQRGQNSEVYAEVYGKRQEKDIPPYAKVNKSHKKQDEEIAPYAEVGNKTGYSEISPYAEVSNKAGYSEISPYAEIGNKAGYSEISPYAEIGNKAGYSEISPYAEIGNKAGYSEISPYAEVCNPDKGGYSEISPYAQVIHKSEIEKSPYAEIKELYSQVQPKSLRHNKDSSTTSYVNNFPDSPYENANRTEYVEPTYTETLRK